VPRAKTIFDQFRKPDGWLGRFILWRMNRGHSNLTDWGLAHISIKESDTILDVGCGGGRTAGKLAARASLGKVYGIDYSPESVAASRKTNARWIAMGRVEIRQGTVSQLPFPDGAFDLVTAVETQYFWPDLAADMREVFRVLKPGGRLAVSDIALKAELPEAISGSLAAYVGCIAGAIRIEDYRSELLKAGFAHVEIIDSGADLNAYSKMENQSACCSPAMDSSSPFSIAQESCCVSAESTVHDDLRVLLSEYDVNSAAASVKVYALKPAVKSCCGTTCCQ